MEKRNVNICNLKRAETQLSDQIPQNVCKLRNKGLSKRTGIELVKKMLEESKEMNNGNEKETRKKRSRQAGKKVAKKRKMGEEGNKKKPGRIEKERSNMGECEEMEKCTSRSVHTNQSCGSNSNNNKNPIPKGCKEQCYLYKEQHG